MKSMNINIIYLDSINFIIDFLRINESDLLNDCKQFSILINNLVFLLKKDLLYFIKLIYFYRSIKYGIGLKYIYYIGMLILKKMNIDIYKYILYKTYQYPKDILKLHKLSNIIYQNFNCEIYLKYDNFNYNTHNFKKKGFRLFI